MEYAAEIWFGNVVLKIDLETYNKADEQPDLRVAEALRRRYL